MLHEIQVSPAPRPLPGQPLPEPGRHQIFRVVLLLGGLHGQVVRVLVSGVSGVSPHPDPLDSVSPGHLIELLPELQILDGPALALPAAGLPAPKPLGHPPRQVLGIGHEPHPGGTIQGPERIDRAPECHAIVRRIRVRCPVVVAAPRVSRPEFYESRRAARAGTTDELVAQTRLVCVNHHPGRRNLIAISRGGSSVWAAHSESGIQGRRGDREPVAGVGPAPRLRPARCGRRAKVGTRRGRRKADGRSGRDFLDGLPPGSTFRGPTQRHAARPCTGTTSGSREE